MEMSVAEIVREYRTAKDQRAQIKILAELNACHPDYIKKILQENGEHVASRGRPAKAPTERTIDKAAVAEREQAILWERERERAQAIQAPAQEQKPVLAEKPGHELPKQSPAREYVEKLVQRRNMIAAEMEEIDRELYGLVHMIADATEKK